MQLYTGKNLILIDLLLNKMKKKIYTAPLVGYDNIFVLSSSLITVFSYLIIKPIFLVNR